MNRRYFLLLGIIFIAAFFRLYEIATVPPSPSLDEVSIGYNAYAILKTGKDEYGYTFPLLLRAYDDWRPGLYVYLVIPFVNILGLTVTAVRLPSVLLSLASVGGTYFLAQELLSHHKHKLSPMLPKHWVGVLAASLLAISPWHIYISRLGHEANLGLTAFLLGLLYFLKAMHNPKRTHLLFVSAGFFVLSLYGYQSQKLIVPVVLLSLALIYWKKLWSIKKRVVAAILLSILLLIPLVLVSISPEALIRLKGTSAFSQDNPLYKERAITLLEAKEKGDLMGQLQNNRRVVSTEIFFSNYIAHFNPVWLFTNTMNGSHKIPGIGLVYIWLIPFLFLGLLVFCIYPIPLQTKLFFAVWFFSSPLASSITTESPHAMRAYTFLPSWQILSAIGFIYLLQKLSGRVAKIVLCLTVGLVAFASMILLYKQYFFAFPVSQSASFQYALSRAIPFVLQHEGEYDQIVFTNTNNGYQSYMFFLFFSQYDPVLYQRQGGTISGGYAQTHAFGKYRFAPLDFSQTFTDKRILYVGNPEDFPDTIGIRETFSYLNGETGIIVVQRP